MSNIFEHLMITEAEEETNEASKLFTVKARELFVSTAVFLVAVGLLQYFFRIFPQSPSNLGLTDLATVGALYIVFVSTVLLIKGWYKTGTLIESWYKQIPPN